MVERGPAGCSLGQEYPRAPELEEDRSRHGEIIEDRRPSVAEDTQPTTTANRDTTTTTPAPTSTPTTTKATDPMPTTTTTTTGILRGLEKRTGTSDHMASERDPKPYAPHSRCIWRRHVHQAIKYTQSGFSKCTILSTTKGTHQKLCYSEDIC